MVNGIYIAGDRRLPAELKKIQKGLGDVQRPTGTEKNRSLLALEEAVGELQVTVAELSARSVATRSPADLTISTDTPGQWPSATRAFSFPAPSGGGRVATLALSAEFVRTTSSGNITIFLELLQNNAVTWRRTQALIVGDTQSAPPAWGNPSINDFIQITVPNAAAASMSIRLYAHTFVGGSVAARMQNIQATLEYGPRL